MFCFQFSLIVLFLLTPIKYELWQFDLTIFNFHQVVRGDLSELWNLDLQGHPYAYTPFCNSNTLTEGSCTILCIYNDP